MNLTRVTYFSPIVCKERHVWQEEECGSAVAHSTTICHTKSHETIKKSYMTLGVHSKYAFCVLFLRSKLRGRIIGRSSLSFRLFACFTYQTTSQIVMIFVVRLCTLTSDRQLFFSVRVVSL